MREKNRAASSAERIDPTIQKHKHVACDRERQEKKAVGSQSSAPAATTLINAVSISAPVKC